MITYKLGETLVSLFTNNTEEEVPIIYGSEIGNTDWEIKNAVENSHDRDGHILGSSSTAMDLQFVMNKKQLKVFKPELLEGKDILEKGKKLPKDVPNYVR